MKIIHLLPSLQSGGVEQVVLELSRGFVEKGHENIVIAEGGRMANQLTSEGSRHISLPIGKKRISSLFLIPRLRKIFIEERPDIIHLHSRMPAWIGRFAWSSLPSSGRPKLVTSVHGFYSVNFYSAVMTKGERVIGVSECIKEYILRRYSHTDEQKIRVIPNSIDSSSHHADFTPHEAWKRGWELDHPELTNQFTLCLPGRISRIKGQLEMIPILRSLLDRGIPAHAVMVGEAKKGKEAYYQEILTAFKEAGLQNNVSWVGHRTDLREIQSVCDVTLSLTLVPESFGKTTLEALALGKPVAGYAHGGVEEQLRIFLPEGMVAPKDTSAMADLLDQWYRNPPSVPQEIPHPFRMEDMIESHLAVYRELTHSS